MRSSFIEAEQYRVQAKGFTSPAGARYGLFSVPLGSVYLKVIACEASDASNRWEHVSVSLPNRCPNWREMSFIKDLFWHGGETVLQFHPKESEYVDIHPNCLHLWKRESVDHELPPMALV